MPPKVTRVPSSQLKIHGLSPVRRFSPERLQLTWQLAEEAGDVDTLVLVASRPELDEELFTKAAHYDDLRVTRAVAGRPDFDPESAASFVNDLGDWPVAWAALHGSGWDSAVVDAAFALVEQLKGAQRVRALEQLWQHAPPQALTSQQCLALLLERAGRLGHWRDAGATCELDDAMRMVTRLDAAQLHVLLRADAAAAGSAWPWLLALAPKVDEASAHWAWAQAAGDEGLRSVVAAAVAGRPGLTPRRLPDGSQAPVTLHVPSPMEATRENRNDMDRWGRHVMLHWAWMVRSGSEHWLGQVWLKLQDLNSMWDLESIAEMMPADVPAMVSLVNRLRGEEWIPLLFMLNVEGLQDIPDGVKVPPRCPDIADLKALGANAFVRSRWTEAVAHLVVLRDGWEHVERDVLARLLREWVPRAGELDLVEDVLYQDPPDEVVGLIPGATLQRVHEHARMVRYMRENLPDGAQEPFAQLAAGPLAEMDLSQVLTATRAIVAPAR